MKKIIFLFIIYCITLCNGLKGQNLYSIDTIRTMELNFYDSNWDHILDSLMLNNSTNRVLADLIVDGIQYDSVGVRFKGNSSYHPDNEKNPFNIEIDSVKEQDLYGSTTLKLNVMFKDPSCIREALSYEMLRNYMPASEANFIVLYIDGNLRGLYVSVESVNKKFLARHFGSNDNSFFKCDPVTITGTPEPTPPGCLEVTGISSPLILMGPDTVCYEQSYEIKSDYGWTKLRNLIEELKFNPGGINQFLDVDRALWMLVFNNIFVNFDSYTGSGHNYYIYENAHSRFNTIIWDLNENFGVFRNGGGPPPGLTISEMQNLEPLWNVGHPKRPLIKQLMAIPGYQKRYFAHYRTFINEFLANNAMKNRAVELQSLIDLFVSNDPNLLYSYSDFQNALDQNIFADPGGEIVGINVLMDERSDFLSAHSEILKQGPVIMNVQQSDSFPSSSDSVWLTAEITNVTQASLSYKSERYAPFQAILMYDDGNHNDGSAGDGVYGALLPAFSPATTVYYYIYAENSEAGKFSPERAEYETYSYTVECSQLYYHDIVINEFMASNSTTVYDQNYEYNDWIEFYNTTAQDISMNGMFLSDDFSFPYKWIFPDTVILANDYLIVWTDNDTTQMGLHTNFALRKSGEDIILLNSDETYLDGLHFGQQYTDTSYGRYPNGTGDFGFMPPTFSADNSTYYGVDEIELTNHFMIYPNPAKDVLYIEFSNPANLKPWNEYSKIEFYNLLMQKIREYSFSPAEMRLSIPLNEFSNGVYIIRIGNYNKKVVINK